MSAAEAYKVFAWKENGYWRGQQLLPVSQIRGLLAALEWKFECFATIQNHDSAGNCLSCPFYFDLDNEHDPSKVLADARHTVHALEFLWNITPRIYFSGSKGFHLVIEHVVEHAQCHLMIAEMAKELSLGSPTHSIDMKVYRTNSMFRIPGSRASKPGYYKIELHREELFELDMDAIRQLATKQRFIDTGHAADAIDTSQLRDWMDEMKLRLPRYDTIKDFTDRHQNLELDFTPCLRKMLAEGVDEGQRNYAVFLLAKFFKTADLDYDSAYNLIVSHAPWARFEQHGREVTKVMRSVYKQMKPAHLGCRGTGQGAELMRAYCHSSCFLREDMDLITAVDDRKAP